MKRRHRWQPGKPGVAKSPAIRSSSVPDPHVGGKRPRAASHLHHAHAQAVADAVARVEDNLVCVVQAVEHFSLGAAGSADLDETLPGDAVRNNIGVPLLAAAEDRAVWDLQ